MVCVPGAWLPALPCSWSPWLAQVGAGLAEGLRWGPGGPSGTALWDDRAGVHGPGGRSQGRSGVETTEAGVRGKPAQARVEDAPEARGFSSSL